MRSKKKSKRAAVLGCGPAGLFAAHALAENGWKVDIFSTKRKSHMFGAQYLHAPIPGLSGVPSLISYVLRGTVEEYRAKVYGARSNVQVSPETLQGEYFCWNIREAYDKAWELYGGGVHDEPNIKPQDVQIMQANGIYQLTFSSIPAPGLCLTPGKHQFSATRIWAIGDAPLLGQYVPFTTAAMTVECNGEPSPRWYRASNIYGHSTIEWPYEPKPPYEGISEVQKPISNTCDCFPNVIRIGRYGVWRKGVLAHHAYETALEMAK